MTVLATVMGALLGAALGGAPGFFIGGLLGLVVTRELSVRDQRQSLKEAEARLARLRAWATEMKAWSEQAYARMSSLEDSEESMDPQPGTDTEQGVSARPEPVPRPVASEPQAAARVDISPPATPAPPDPATRAPHPAGSTPAEPTPAEPTAEPTPAEPTPARAEATGAPEPVSVAASAESWPDDVEASAASRGAPPRQPLDPLTRLVDAVKKWITTGNAPVKVGVLVSLIGVGLLLREASRRGVITFTIEMRLIAVTLFGLALLAIGWRLRRKNPIYGLSLQGGGVAVLYLTTYTSFAVYDVLPTAPAAVAVITVTVGAGVLSVTQDSPPLAVLGMTGGFLAPVLTYTSPHDHVLVFGFYTVLSATIVAVAWYKTWPLLNLLGLGFTFGIAAFWLWRRFDEDKWADVQPLIGVLILLYLAIPVLFAIREAPDLRRPSTAPLVFGTPLLGFGLQYLAVGHTDHGMAVSAAALALVHGVLAAVAHRLGRECRSLAEANVGLGATFAVIAVPLAFDAHLTAVVWAAQGGLLVWIGCRRTRVPAVVAGGVLQVVAAAVFLGHLLESLPYPQDALPVANEFFLGSAVLAGTGLMTGRMVHGLRSRVRVDAAVPWLALVWGSSWWIASGLTEIGYQLTAHRLSVSLCFVVLSFGAASLLADRLRWPHLHALGVAIGPTLWLAAVVSLISQELHPLDRFGWAAWPVSFAVFYWFLRIGEDRFLQTGEDRFLQTGGDRFRMLAGVLHGGAYWLLALLAVSEVSWQTDRAAEGVWLIVVPAAAGTALAAAALLGGRWLRWPLLAHRRVYVSTCAGPALLFAAVAVGVACLMSPGDPSPLPYVPLLNPLIVLLAALAWVGSAWVAAARSGRDEPAGGEGPPMGALAVAAGGEGALVRALAVAAGGVALATMELARTVHHWWDVPWDAEALVDSTAFQSSLTILWTLIALAAMVAGARSGRRAVWAWGGRWMAVVLVKLLAVDLNSLTVPGRAVSFIGTGVLLLVIGYLAPAAPAAAAAAGPEPGPQPDGPAAGVGGISWIDGEWLTDRFMRWLTAGNWPARVGVLVSLVGAGTLLTEAAGRDLLASSIETRLAAVTAGAAVLLVIGWVQRRNRPAFGLSLQGGGIALLHVAVFAGYPVHGVIGAAPAGVAVVAVTAGAVVLSVVQDSRALAVLGTVGGFLAPVLTYTSPDDHAVLFGFYAILSLAIVVVAWFKAWPELNLLGWVSTFGVAAWWLQARFDPDDWMAVQPLIAVLVLLYMAIPAISARRGAPETHEMWMHPLVFGTPFIALGVQQMLVGHVDYALAVSALGLALALGGLVAIVRGLGTESRELTATYAGLSTVFVAIAVPLALNGAYGAIVWAAQGALLVWIGCRRGRMPAIVGGGVLQALAGAWFAVRLSESLPYETDVRAVANEYLLAAAGLAVAGLVSGWRMHLASERVRIHPAVGWLVLGWGTAWWLTGGLVEIGSQIPEHWLPASLAFVVVLSGVAVAAAGPLRWRRLDALGLLIPPALVAALVVSLSTRDHPLDRFGWAAWPVSMAVFYGCLHPREEALGRLAARWHARLHGDPPASGTARGPVPLAAWLHTAGFWMVAVIAAMEVRWQIVQVAEGVWPLAVTTAVAMVLAGAPMAARRWLAWPFGTHSRTYTLACSGPLLMVLAVVVLGAAVFSDGDPSPLLYLPVANPLGVLVGMQLAMLLAWRRRAKQQWDHPFQGLVDARWSPTLIVLGVIITTAETARTVHHWLDVPWDFESLWESTALQTSLSIQWAVQGTLLVWVGCRRGRMLPIAGGMVLQALAGGWFAVRLGESLPHGSDVLAVANQYLLVAVVLAVAGMASGWRAHLASERVGIDAAVGWLALAWGAVWWLTGGLVEIGSQIPDYWLPASLVFVVASFGAAVAAAGPLRWPHLNALGLLIPPALVTALVVSLSTQDHPLDGFGWAAWPVSLVVFYGCLHPREEALGRLAARWHARLHGDPPAPGTARGPVPLAGWLHTAGFWIVVVIAGMEVRWQIVQVAEGVWPLAVTTAAGVLLAAAPMAARRWLAWPFGMRWRTYTLAGSGPLLVVLAVVVFGAAVVSDGDPSPLLYLPVVNPLGVLVGMQLAVSLAWRRRAEEQWDHPFQGLVDARWSPTLFVLGVILATAETARTVHHWLDVPWDFESLWDSTALQTSLSILWAVIGLSGMVAGVRMARRAVWVAGASWMAVVVAKLFVVDLRNLSAAGRVVSFIVVGVLLLIVGYLAPVPPAGAEESEEPSEDPAPDEPATPEQPAPGGER